MFCFTQEAVSRAFWDSLPDDLPDLQGLPNGPGVMRKQNLRYLAGLCVKLKPRCVIEIGYGASSTMMVRSGVRRILSCDRDAPDKALHPQIELHRCESTEFLKTINEAPDMFVFDGRLKREDAEEIRRLSGPLTWLVFDDFEGLEKGVSNAALLRGENHYLITPQPGPLGRATLAVLAPVSQLAFSIYG